MDELERRRLASERAVLEAEQALIDAKENRDSLISVSDIEELTGSVAREAARGVAEGLQKKPSNRVEVSWLGIKAKGTLWRILVLLLLIGVIVTIVTLFSR